MTREEYESRGDEKMEVWLNYITRELGIDSVRANMNDKEFDNLAAQVDEYLEIIEDR
jgi:hypothetical protein